MGRAVGADQPAAVDRQHHRQVLHRDVVDQLVVGALQEGRVDRHHRLHAFAGEARGEGHRVLLGDADIEIALRKFLRETHHAGAFAHRRGDADQALVLRRHVAQPVAEHLRVGRFGDLPFGIVQDRFGDNALSAIELAHAVIQQTILFGQRVALALLRDDVQELRAAQFADIAQRIQQHIQIVAVDRADVVEAEFLEQGAGHHHALDVLFGALGEFQHRRHTLQHLSRCRAASPHKNAPTSASPDNC